MHPSTLAEFRAMIWSRSYIAVIKHRVIPISSAVEIADQALKDFDARFPTPKLAGDE